MNRVTPNDNWVRNPDGTLGFTCNVITGCLQGCEYCFARKIASGRCRQRYLANHHIYPNKPGDAVVATYDSFYPRLWPERLDEIEKRKKPAGIFLSIMGEIFGDWIPVLWQIEIMKTIDACPHHRFYLLTHQPQNLITFSPFPENCYVGVTAVDQGEWDNALYHLQSIKAPVKFISVEPMLGHIAPPRAELGLRLAGVNWVIIGSQVRPTKYPQMRWVRQLVSICDLVGMPVFLKENMRLLLKDSILRDDFGPFGRPWGGDDIMLRQEVPDG